MAKYHIDLVGRTTVRPFKLEDVKNIMIMLEKARDASTSPYLKYIYDRDWLLVKLGVNTAFRIQDLLLIRLDDNLKHGIMYIRERKTKKEQSWTLNSKLKRDLDNYIKRNNLYEGEFLFKNNRNKNEPISRVNAWKRIKKYAKEIGVTYKVGCHSLRKCFARTFYEEKHDLLTLQRMLNHSNPAVTLRYICWDEEDQQSSRKDFYL